MNTLNDLTGVKAVSKLKEFAIEMNQDSNGSSGIERNYSVTLKYNDSDGDTVRIFKDFDIYHAMQEYASVRKVKILAELSVNTTTFETSSRASASTQTFVFNVDNNQAPPSNNTTTTQEKEEPEIHVFSSTSSGVKDPPPEVASSIADILRFAANVAGTATSAQACKVVNDAMKHVNKAAEVMEEKVKQASATAQANVEQGSKNAARAARQANRSARKAARVARRSVNLTSANGEKNVVLETAGGVAPRNTPEESRNSEFCEPGSGASPEFVPKTSVQPETKIENAFIHGRHTCDSCLTTPIIGKRFRAINRADFDYCEKCYLNYKGDVLKFEEEILGK